MGSKAKTPAAPNYAGLANNQADADLRLQREQNYANRPNLRTPYGTQTWDTNDGRWYGSTALAPELQSAFNQNLSQVQNSYAQPIGTNFEDYRRKILASQLERFSPKLERDRSALENRLLNQGIPLGSSAYSAAMGDLADDQNRFLLDADIGAGNQAEQMFRVQSQMQDRPLSVLQQILMGATQAAPAVAPAGRTRAADQVTAAQQQYQADIDRYNAKQAGGDWLSTLINVGAKVAPYVL